IRKSRPGVDSQAQMPVDSRAGGGPGGVRLAPGVETVCPGAPGRPTHAVSQPRTIADLFYRPTEWRSRQLFLFRTGEGVAVRGRPDRLQNGASLLHLSARPVL